MPKINPAEYGGQGERKPPLTPPVLGNADAAVLTIANVRADITTGDGRKTALLEFSEQPDYVFWLNKTGIESLVARLGDNTDDWVGERVPLVRVRVNNPATGKMVVKYQVADAEDWDDLLAEVTRRRRGRPSKKGK
jgi:hypothetical protein